MFSPASIRKGGCNERLRTRPGQPSGNVPAIPMTGWAVLNGVLSLHDTLLTVFLPLWILTATEPRTQRWPSPSSLMPGPGSHPPSPCIQADGHYGRCGPRRPACRARSGLHVPRYGGHVLLIGPGHPGGSAGRLYGAMACPPVDSMRSRLAASGTVEQRPPDAGSVVFHRASAIRCPWAASHGQVWWPSRIEGKGKL